MTSKFPKDLQYYKFCGYGFFKNLRFFDPFIMLFFREMGLSFFSIGILFSIREISINILEVPSGAFADLMGRRGAMMFSFACYIFSYILFYFFGGIFLVAALAMVAYACGDAFRSGTHKAMILEYLRLKNLMPVKVNYYGSTRACSQVGSALSAVVAAALVYFSGEIRIVYLASVAPYLAGFLLLWSYPKNLDNIQKDRKISPADFFAFLWQNIKTFVSQRQLRRVILNTTLISASFKFSKDYLQPILKTAVISLPVFVFLTLEKRTAILIGAVYSLIYFISAIASKNAHVFQARSGNAQKSLNINFVINATLYLGSGVFLLLGWRFAAILLFVLIFVIQNFSRPIMVGYLGEITDARNMATTLSLENQSRAIFVMIFAPVMGWLVDVSSVGMGLAVFGGFLTLLSFFIKIK